jgi:hypothetical protein
LVASAESCRFFSRLAGNLLFPRRPLTADSSPPSVEE